MSNLSNMERFIEMDDGTAIGQAVKNMLNNGTDLEHICEYAGIDFYNEDDN